MELYNVMQLLGLLFQKFVSNSLSFLRKFLCFVNSHNHCSGYFRSDDSSTDGVSKTFKIVLPPLFIVESLILFGLIFNV